MRYYLECSTLDSQLEIDIDDERFNSLKQAKDSLFSGLAIEEKYELLISNYIEFEKEITSVSVDYMVRSEIDYFDLFDKRLALNRRIVNLLSATRMYVDQLGQHVKMCVPDQNHIEDEVKRLSAEEYDLNFEYRFMEALRNYVQHRGLAIHNFIRGGRWTKEENSYLEYYLKLITQKNILEGDKAFKQQVFKEMPDEVELTHAIRVYVSSISKIHKRLRELIKDNMINSRDIFDHTIKEYKEQSGKESISLRAIAVKKSRPDEILGNVPIFLDWDDVRIKLTKRNPTLAKLEKRYLRGKPGL